MSIGKGERKLFDVNDAVSNQARYDNYIKSEILINSQHDINSISDLTSLKTLPYTDEILSKVVNAIKTIQILPEIGENPVFNKDFLGNKITPWWLYSNPGDRIPGYGGGVPSLYKSFLSGEALNNFNKAAFGLYNSNSIFRKTVDMLQASKTAYSVQQRYETSVTIGANYNSQTKTLQFMYDGASPAELFEETFHAGQDDYYSSQGIKRSNLENEVEAKVANMLSGLKDASVKKDYSNLKKSFKTGDKGKAFDNDLKKLIDEVYKSYSEAKGKDWAKENDPSTVDRATVLKYLESLQGEPTEKKK